MSRASHVLKIARPIRSRAASTRSVMALPFGDTTASRTRRSAAFPALDEAEAFELGDLAADRRVIAPDAVGELHNADRAEPLDGNQQRKQRPIERNPGLLDQRLVALRPVHGADDVEDRRVKLAQLRAYMCILHFFP